ncbi:uncharacterized protein LOC135494894 [Lineus longissimus]|uniref:uncharacterized protein LOC135494894 n=1 Tax=Lineus longissimus TaxID=88925 RepID=UPI002B4F344F
MRTHRGVTVIEQRIIQAKKWKKQEMNLSGCHLITLHPSISQEPLLSILTQLELGHNLLRSLPEFTWQLCNLEKLILKHNFLQELSEGVTKLKKLSYLDVSHNEIQAIPPAVAQLDKLQYFNLSGNQLKYLDLRILYLPQLRRFFVTKNPIENIPRDVFLGGLRSLRCYFDIPIDIPSHDDSLDCSLDSSILDEIRQLKLRPFSTPQSKSTHQSEPRQVLNAKLRRSISFSCETLADSGIYSLASLNLEQPVSRRLSLSTNDIETSFGILPERKTLDQFLGSESESNCGDQGSDESMRALESDGDITCCSDCQCSEDTDDSQYQEKVLENGCKVLKHKNVTVTLPPKNESGYDLGVFELEIVEDLSYSPDTSERAVHASQVVSMEPHGTRFTTSDPALIDIPITVPVDSVREIVCLCSETSIGECVDWKEMDSSCFELKGNRVIIQTTHFSLFTILVKKSFPETRQLISANQGGRIMVEEVPGVGVIFPRRSLHEDIEARVKVVYGDEPYCLDFNHGEEPRALATPVVMLEPHGCQFKATKHPVVLSLPLPDCARIQNHFGQNAERDLTIWCSQTAEEEELDWHEVKVSYKVRVDGDSNFCVQIPVQHFCWYRALWDSLASKMYECKIGVTYFYPYIQFSMMCQAMMDENPDNLSFGLEVICYHSDKRFPEAGNYRHKVGSSLKPRMIKKGSIAIRLRSDNFEADTENGENPELHKIEFDFRGREFEKQFACVYKHKPKDKGVFGKVFVERLVQPGIVEPLFEFNLTKSGHEAETILESTDRWSLLAVKELASMLNITNDENWKVFAKHLGFTNHEVNHKLAYTADPFAFMLGVYQSRGGTPDEFVQSLYKVGRELRMNATGVPLKELDQIGFTLKSGLAKSRFSNSTMEEGENSDGDDYEEPIEDVVKKLGSHKSSTPKRKRSSRAGSSERSITKKRRLSLNSSEHLSDISVEDESFFVNKQEMDDSDLWRLSQVLLQSWKNLGRALRIPEEDLLSIEHSHKTEARECAYQMLLKFKCRYPNKCRYGYLYRILCENGLKGVAQKHCKPAPESDDECQ